ncbi:MAG: DUF5652 family protein [Candidatus Pacebacteria bacterium]|jgi:hypothetical protein|nr:DUF5652 family protein [Candidatus Paceibacterota bacterium]
MNTLMQYGPLISLLIILWVLPWKGYALWTAAKRSHKVWFIALLILNTFAILDIFYLFYIAKKQIKDIKHDLKGTAKKLEHDVEKVTK